MTKPVIKKTVEDSFSAILLHDDDKILFYFISTKKMSSNVFEIFKLKKEAFNDFTDDDRQHSQSSQKSSLVIFFSDHVGDHQ